MSWAMTTLHSLLLHFLSRLAGTHWRHVVPVMIYPATGQPLPTRTVRVCVCVNPAIIASPANGHRDRKCAVGDITPPLPAGRGSVQSNVAGQQRAPTLLMRWELAGTVPAK